MEAAHAFVKQSHPFFRQLRGGVPRLRPHREMVSLAEHQGSRAQGRAPAVPAVRVPARQRLDVPDAGAGLAGIAAGVPMLWLFNIVGLLDLIYANISTFKDHVDPVYLGVSYYLAVLNVPAMVVVHVLIFVYLLRAPARLRISPSE